MTESIEDTRAEIERLQRKLADYRALRERIRKDQLQADDWSVLSAMLSELIEQAEAAGQEWVTIGLSEDEEDSLDRQTGTTSSVHDSTSESPRR